MLQKRLTATVDGMYILRASFTDKSEVKHYAKDYGKRAFRILVGPGPEPVKGN